MEPSPAPSTASLLRAIETNPLDLRAYCTLAGVYMATGEFHKAGITLRRVIEIDPFHHEAWQRLGIAHSNEGEWPSAVEALAEACALDPTDATSRVAYGLALIATQDLRAAAEVRDTLLERFPGRAESYLIAGHISKIHGRFDEAAQHYRRALELDPRQTEAIFNLVDLSPPEPSDPFTANLEKLRQDPALSHRQSANLHFALARIYERAAQVERAFAAYSQANAAAAAMLGELGNAYDPRRAEEETRQIIERFPSEILAQPLEPLDLELKLIFVVGMPRSGTTLVERILSSCPGVSTGGELPFMQRCLSNLLARGLRLDDARQRQLLLNCREEYLDGLFERELDDGYVIDKLPVNFSALGLIRLLFPDALMIHCARDPVATCWSLYCAHFGTHLAYYTSLEHLVHYYRNVYCRSMAHWRRVLGSQIVDVQYERLVANPEHEVRELLKQCSLPWDDACLNFHRNEQPIYTANMQQARLPFTTESIARWRPFEQQLTPLLEGLRGTAPELA